MEYRELPPSARTYYEHQNKGLPTATAIAEFIDNSFVTGNQFWLVLGQDYVIVADNGEGISNMDDIIGVGYSSYSQNPKAISEYGVGSKDAQMHFGEQCRIQTVYNNSYYDFTIDWGACIRDSKHPMVPKNWNDAALPVTSAPKNIRPSGTMLTIRKLHRKRYHNGRRQSVLHNGFVLLC